MIICQTYRLESLLIHHTIGLQLTTSYALARTTTIFIHSDRIKDIFINEGFHSVRRDMFSFLSSSSSPRSIDPLFFFSNGWFTIWHWSCMAMNIHWCWHCFHIFCHVCLYWNCSINKSLLFFIDRVETIVSHFPSSTSFRSNHHELSGRGSTAASATVDHRRPTYCRRIICKSPWTFLLHRFSRLS